MMRYETVTLSDGRELTIRRGMVRKAMANREEPGTTYLWLDGDPWDQPILIRGEWKLRRGWW